MMRHALVIGNSRYRQLPELRNPCNDALLIGRQLSSLGFAVTQISDASYRDLLGACTTFNERLSLAGENAIALFYYAGHGVQVAGQNFLLPVDMAPDDAGWLDRVSLSLDWVLHRALQTRTRQTRVAVVDACRNNPFSSRGEDRTREALSQHRGLAQAISPPETLIAFSTSPGHVALDGLGDHGLYAAALAEAMVTPDLPVERVFKLVRTKVHAATRGAQVPWEHSSLIEELCFAVGEPAGALSRGLPPAATMQGVIQKGIARYDPRQVGHLIHKLKARDSTGRWAYYFVFVEEKNTQAFLDALRSEEPINIENYGNVIASNYGDEPSPEVKRFFKENYGFDI